MPHYLNLLSVDQTESKQQYLNSNWVISFLTYQNIYI